MAFVAPSRRESAYMMVPIYSPLSAWVKLPFSSPFR